MFEDTFLGAVKEERSLGKGPIWNNTFALRTNNELKTLLWATTEDPEALLGPTENDRTISSYDAFAYQLFSTVDKSHFS